MRTIEFRGKDIDTGEWRYGDLQHSIMGIVITYLIDLPPTHNDPGGDIKREYTEVIPETVGQFTGLTDKNGNKIFEGDINVDKSVVNFENGIYYSGNNSLFYLLYHCETLEIIGNIHDNFELI